MESSRGEAAQSAAGFRWEAAGRIALWIVLGCACCEAQVPGALARCRKFLQRKRMKELQSLLGKLQEMENFNCLETTTSPAEPSSVPSSFQLLVEVALLFYLEKID